MRQPRSLPSMVCLALFAIPMGCADIESTGEDPGEARGAVAGDTLDTEFAPAATGSVTFTSTSQLAQIYKVRYSGSLTRIALEAAPCDSTRRSCDFTVNLKTLDAGRNPSSVVLTTARARQPLPQAGAYAWVEINFATAVPVVSGQEIAIEIIPDTGMTVPISGGYTASSLKQWQSGFNSWSNLTSGNGYHFRAWVLRPPPVLGAARCDESIRLRSWKGDYLHRPDSPQGVTTWSFGTWTVECVAGGKIQLRSWKNDYLHRPDSPQGVTTWAFGEWTPENLPNGNVQLRSWKGDYLHRPDSPQGVTTWAFGEWAVELVP